MAALLTRTSICSPALHRHRDGRLHLRGAGDIALGKCGLPALSSDGFDGFVAMFRIEIDDQHAAAFGGELLATSAADARSAAGDDANFVLESHMVYNDTPNRCGSRTLQINSA